VVASGDQEALAKSHSNGIPDGETRIPGFGAKAFLSVLACVSPRHGPASPEWADAQVPSLLWFNC
jgi:hypothetical protein